MLLADLGTNVIKVEPVPAVVKHDSYQVLLQVFLPRLIEIND